MLSEWVWQTITRWVGHWTLLILTECCVYAATWQFDQQLVTYIFSVMTRDALLTSHPVSAKIRDPDDITLYFDAISYDKVSDAAVARIILTAAWRIAVSWDVYWKLLQRCWTQTTYQVLQVIRSEERKQEGNLNTKCTKTVLHYLPSGSAPGYCDVF